MAEKVKFRVFVPEGDGTLDEQVHELKTLFRDWLREEGLSPASLVQSRIYLTDAANQWEAVAGSSLYSYYLSAGAVSYVEQPLLCGAKVALQVWCVDEERMCKSGTPDCRIVTVGGIRYIFHSVRFGREEAEGLDAEGQTREAFKRHIALLGKEGLTLKDHCRRTWIYVRDIDRHYAGVVAGRNRVFAEEGLTSDTHYIASTGIGGGSLCKEALVAIDFFSVAGLPEEAVDYLHAPDYLNPTHEYGVAFERGTRLCLPGCRLLLISGTASIDKHGECLHRGNVLEQADRLFLNIDKLLESKGASLADLRYAIVYLRDIADYRRVERYVKSRFPDLPCLFTEARVCRPEWLIEVEGIAVE